MAIKNLFGEIERALEAYKSSEYKKNVLHQTQSRETDIFYTNDWVENIYLQNIMKYIYGRKSGVGEKGISAPARQKSVSYGRTKEDPRFKGVGPGGPYRYRGESKLESVGKPDKDKLYKIIEAIVKKAVKAENIVTNWKKATGTKAQIGAGKSKSKRLKGQKMGYIKWSKNKESGGGVKLTIYGGTDRRTIAPMATDYRGDTVASIQHAFLNPLMNKIIKKAKKDSRIKKLMRGNTEISEMMNIRHDEGLSKQFQSFKGAQKLHAGAGSKKPGHTYPKSEAFKRVNERAANDPGFGADSDTTVKMMNFLEGMEDNFKNRKGFKDLTTGTDDPTLRAIMKEINDPFNAAYTIEGVDHINLFGGSNRGKRYKGSKDIIATKDITVKIALGTSDQNALARKADSSRTTDKTGKSVPKTTYEGGLDVGLDSFFYHLRRHLEKKFKGKPKEEASLSIMELARRGVFANVAKNMKTASGMPDMRFKVNKRIFAEAQQRFAKQKGRGKKNLQRGGTKIKKQQAQKLKPLTKGAGVAGAAIGANMIRNRVGSNPLALESILEKALPKVVASKMTAPALVYRTGRFAESAQIEDVMMGPRGGMHIDYTYARDPYETFEPGNRQGSTYRDPRKIIGSSVREIAQSIVGNKFIKIRRT